MAQMSLEELRENVKGKSDDDIDSIVASLGGADRLLALVFDRMKFAFDPSKAGSQSAVCQYDVDTPEGIKSFQVRIVDGTCDILQGTPEKPRVTLALSLPNFLRLMTGNLNGMQAFMSGQLRLAGDVMFAQTMQTWFIQK